MLTVDVQRGPYRVSRAWAQEHQDPQPGWAHHSAHWRGDAAPQHVAHLTRVRERGGDKEYRCFVQATIFKHETMPIYIQ